MFTLCHLMTLMCRFRKTIFKWEHECEPGRYDNIPFLIGKTDFTILAYYAVQPLAKIVISVVITEDGILWRGATNQRKQTDCRQY